MRNLLFVALIAAAALSTGCNGIHKRGGGCPGGACGGGCPGGACSGGYAMGRGGHGGCDACGGYGHGGDGRFAGDGIGGGGHFGGGAGGQHGMQGVPHHFSREYQGPQGPPTAQVAYPYYTTRGPRDYFANQPMSIGY